MPERPEAADIDLLDLLRLEPTGADEFQASVVYEWFRSLYGGQVAAQALMAAGQTVSSERHPHSLHAYFLRAGDSKRPVTYRVHVDRDGRSFSARRVTATQDGKEIFTMLASFHDGSKTPLPVVLHGTSMPQTSPAEDCPPSDMTQLFSIETRAPVQPYADRSAFVTRFWARADIPLPDDPLIHAAALAYISDLSTGVLEPQDAEHRVGPSIDHALWFHGQVNMNLWTLTDYQPKVTGNGRASYTGLTFSSEHRLIASCAQETLFR